MEALRQNTGEIGCETTTGHVGEAVHSSPGHDGRVTEQVDEVRGIHPRRGEQLLAERSAEVGHFAIERPSRVGDDPPHQGIAIGVQARGREAQHDVALADALGREDVGVLDDSGGRSSAVVFVRLEQAGVLRGLTADQRHAGLLAGPCDPAHDGRDPLGDDLATGDVVGHEERFGAADDDVIDDHADEVEADRVVNVQSLSDGDLGTDSVGGGRQNRAGHSSDGRGIEHAGEAAQPTQDLRASGPTDRLLHQLDGLVACLDVDAGCGIRDRFTHGASLRSRRSSADSMYLATGFRTLNTSNRRTSGRGRVAA